ncbi:MAG: hypothetical protein AAF525_08290 [Pseudomonadota bacterium]
MWIRIETALNHYTGLPIALQDRWEMPTLMTQLRAWFGRSQDHHKRNRTAGTVVPAATPICGEVDEPVSSLVLPTSRDVSARVLSYLFETPIDQDRKMVRPHGRVANLVKSLRNPVFRQSSIPRVPVIFPQLLRTLRDPESTSQDLVDLIERDPTIASAVPCLSSTSTYIIPTT